MNLNNARSALKALQKAQALDRQATRQDIRARDSQRGGHPDWERAERNANDAAALFLQVEGYLERLT